MENEVLYLTIGKVVSLNDLAEIKFMLTCHMNLKHRINKNTEILNLSLEDWCLKAEILYKR